MRCAAARRGRDGGGGPEFLRRGSASRLSEESPFLLYFAGHGVAGTMRTDEGAAGVSAPAGRRVGEARAWLGMDALREALGGLACRHLLVVLDCCYAGAFRWATATRDIAFVQPAALRSQYERYLEGKAWQALTSASADEKAADAAAAGSPTGAGPPRRATRRLRRR